ncbi:MAG: queuosine precursor transporter [Sphingomonadales bacterium]|nr:queuosine precursor transporter [Sphingomonadales bacterium]
MTRHKLLLPITALFASTLLISNTLDTKIFALGGLELPAGIILFPLAYVFGDILTEVYGYATSRRTIWTGFACLILMVVFYEIARALPPSPSWPGQPAFDSVFSHVPRIVLASIIAYLCGEFVNSFVVAKFKVLQNGKHMALRFVASTIAGQAIDTTLFVLVAFWGVLPTSVLLSIILSGWAVKVGWEIIALPLTIFVVRQIKRIEQEDVYDRDISFSPFKL